MLEQLSDVHIRLAIRILFITAAWGAISTIAMQVFMRMHMTTKASVVSNLMRMLPVSVIPGSRYFIYFILGYLVKRMEGLKQERYNSFLLLGMIATAISFILPLIGFNRDDPNPLWIFSTIATFFVFNRLVIRREKFRRFLLWTAKRSYTVYLIQYTVISFVSKKIGLFQYFASHGCGVFLSIVAWVLQVFMSYGLSLILASIFDATILKGVQVCLETIEGKLSHYIRRNTLGEN